MSDPTATAPARPAVRPFAWTVAAAALLGAVFSGLSTSDFVKHLDRQVHSIHCSFIPGAGAELGESGCRTVMLSPYSSLLRGSMWGGLPLSLLAFAVFAYLVMRASRLALAPAPSRHDTTFLLAATALPVAMSLLYGAVAVIKIGAVCKLCVGVYLSSGVAFAAAIGAFWKSERPVDAVPPRRLWARWFAEGCGYVAVLVLAYVLFAPTTGKPAEGCGTLAKPDDPAGIMLRLGTAQGGTPSIAVIDPLCPSCRNFDARLRASGLIDRLQLDTVLFPLDATCNWMVKESLHPGACAVSEAMLCDKAGAAAILDYAFGHQDELREEAKDDEPKLRRRLEAAFPRVKGCLGTPAIRAKLNRSLRWAVANSLPVLTPQLFVADRRVCDEDTDLGLEFTVGQMLAAATTPERR